MNTIGSLHCHMVTVLASAADRYNADPESSKIDMRLADHVTFLLTEGAGGVGTAKLQVFAYDAAGANGEAVTFKYRVSAAGVYEPMGAVTEAAVAADGYTTVAGADKQVAVEVQGKGLPEGKPLVSLKITEVVNNPVNAGVMAIVCRQRYGEDLATTFIK